MKNLTVFKFQIDKAHNLIHVNRSFQAPLSLVWDAWTQADILDQWWAPKPWKAETKTMDFREGGHWLYAMVGPNGEKHWSKSDYKSIYPKKHFSSFDSFCDDAGVINTSMPSHHWDNNFEEQDGQTIVRINLTFDTLEDLEQIIEMGFKEGFESGLNNLDEFFDTKSK